MRPLARPRMRNAVVLLPNGFTLGNLLFGVFAIVSASRKDFIWAGWCVVLGGVMDLLDGRIARMTRTGSRFGIELDSLVDAVSFGLAPSMIMYFAVLNQENWSWLFCFFYTACAVMRLARFNVEQGGRAKTHFHGLPSPAAGMTLATYYWFSQTNLYSQTFVGSLPWHAVLPGVMLVLSFLMISHVLYPALPKFSVRSPMAVVRTVGVIGILCGVLYKPLAFAFPVLVAYVGYGLVKTVFLGLVDRLPSEDPLLDEDEEGEEENGEREIEFAESPLRGRRRDRRASAIARAITGGGEAE
ncbi:MAG TPA: CDP-diacylglycerol--serine O-phosphatidyltransferase [Gemmatimonadaceae bacterium]|nr:CDP-diacylglycerol--serine O-phosphatidyltransferase [Gemmatimonadaceae bacterium]